MKRNSEKGNKVATAFPTEYIFIGLSVQMTEHTTMGSIFLFQNCKHIFKCQDKIYFNNMKRTNPIYYYRDYQRYKCFPLL